MRCLQKNLKNRNEERIPVMDVAIQREDLV